MRLVEETPKPNDKPRTAARFKASINGGNTSSCHRCMANWSRASWSGVRWLPGRCSTLRSSTPRSARSSSSFTSIRLFSSSSHSRSRVNCWRRQERVEASMASDAGAASRGCSRECSCPTRFRPNQRRSIHRQWCWPLSPWRRLLAPRRVARLALLHLCLPPCPSSVSVERSSPRQPPPCRNCGGRLRTGPWPPLPPPPCGRGHRAVNLHISQLPRLYTELAMHKGLRKTWWSQPVPVH